MGMFDTVICDFKLLPITQINISDAPITAQEIKSLNYQTKDLGNSLFVFKILEDGTVKQVIYRNFLESVPEGFEFVGMTGHDHSDEDILSIYTKNYYVNSSFTFYSYEIRDNADQDYFIEWYAKVSDGKVVAVDLHELTFHSNSERKLNLERAKQEKEQYDIYINSFQYKYFLKYIDQIKVFIVRKLITFLQKCLNCLYKSL